MTHGHFQIDFCDVIWNALYILSLFLGSIDAGTWRGYRLYWPRMGPIDNFSLVTGSVASSKNHQHHHFCITCTAPNGSWCISKREAAISILYLLPTLENWRWAVIYSTVYALHKCGARDVHQKTPVAGQRRKFDCCSMPPRFVMLVYGVWHQIWIYWNICDFVHSVVVGVLVDRLETCMVMVMDRFYWTIWVAVEQKVPFSVVDTVEWGVIIAATAKTFLSTALSTFCYVV